MFTNTRKSLHYGSISEAEVLRKQEETYMGESDEYGYSDSGTEYLHKSYARNMTTDRSPDAPYFESDKQVRNPQRAAERLNLIYNATRGDTAEIPSHPELFIGLTERDPRGVTNDPLLYKARDHLIAGSKGARMIVQMGNNDDNHIAERPMTQYEQIRQNQENYKTSRRNFKMFLREKMGQSTNQNTRNIDFHKYYSMTDNTIREEFLHNNEQYSLPANPEDIGGIYGKVDTMTQLKGHILAAQYQASNVADDLIAAQKYTEHMANLQKQLETIQVKGPVSHEDVTAVARLTEQLSALHEGLDSINFRIKAAEDDMTKGNFQSHFSGKLGQEYKSVSQKIADRNFENIRDVQSYSDLDIKRAESDGAQTKTYKSLEEAVDKIKTMHLPATIVRDDTRAVHSYKSTPLAEDRGRAAAPTAQNMTFFEQILTSKGKTPVETANTNTEINRLISKDVSIYGDNYMVKPGSSGALPKSQRNSQMDEDNIITVDADVRGVNGAVARQRTAPTAAAALRSALPNTRYGLNDTFPV